MNVVVWNEFFHEKEKENVRAIYPEGIHKCIADFLKCDDLNITIASLDDPECDLTQEVIDNTDVLLWWGHAKHNDVPDEVAVRVKEAVLSGMGFIALHSAHHSKPFKLLMGTSCHLGWREDGDWERIVQISASFSFQVDRAFSSVPMIQLSIGTTSFVVTLY